MESTAWNPESKTVLDSLIWGDKAFKGIETKILFYQHSYMVIFFLLLLKLSEHRLQISFLNPKLQKAIFMVCLKNEQECNIRSIIIHDYGFLNGLKISDIDQLILALIFRFGHCIYMDFTYSRYLHEVIENFERTL